ncbi:tyrosine-type recombinase/integrase [Paenibacillus athensensis]|uniref:Integrase n=1 Tax=Paenibacillus athensensis TaxID=1967502 RepID=A0A4Y8PYK5_9BACL|nr:tyrosine-type recombinase/integrase [Paenibacillus athensensis]MCD1261257.1 tyrosine-type recombinase/integrase [Paenibacillus athensensis]
MTRRKNALATIEQAAPQNPVLPLTFDHALKSFLLHNRAKNLSPRTLGFYEEALRHLHKSFQQQQLPLELNRMTAQQIKQRYIGYMLDNGLASNTVNNRIRACKTFFRYLFDEKLISHNIADQFHLIKAEKKMIQTLTKEQIIHLLNQPDQNTFTGFRDYTIMILLLETGMRISECIALQVNDINLKEQEISIKMGKGRKSRRVPIQKTCIRALNKYLAERGDLETNALFVNVDNEPVKVRTIQENIQTYGKTAQISGVRVSPHTFRHTMAKFYIMNGGDIFTLQRILGHSTLDMVRHYVELFSTDIQEQHQKYSPVENMNLLRKIR